jgi:hypothetical protein
MKEFFKEVIKKERLNVLIPIILTLAIFLIQISDSKIADHSNGILQSGNRINNAMSIILELTIKADKYELYKLTGFAFGTSSVEMYPYGLGDKEKENLFEKFQNAEINSNEFLGSLSNFYYDELLNKNEQYNKLVENLNEDIKSGTPWMLVRSVLIIMTLLLLSVSISINTKTKL